MAWLSGALRELFSLFVDDVPYTLALVVWVAAAVLGLPRLALDPAWDAPLLALGCAAVLVAGAYWAARRHRRELDARAAQD